MGVHKIITGSDDEHRAEPHAEPEADDVELGTFTHVVEGAARQVPLWRCKQKVVKDGAEESGVFIRIYLWLSGVA